MVSQGVIYVACYEGVILHKLDNVETFLNQHSTVEP